MKQVLEQEYVYNADETEDFRVVRIALGVTEMEEFITVKTEENMTLSEIDRVLRGFESDVLSRMDIKLDANYPARLEYKGKTLKIAFGEDHKVKGIVPYEQ